MDLGKVRCYGGEAGPEGEAVSFLEASTDGALEDAPLDRSRRTVFTVRLPMLIGLAAATAVVATSLWHSSVSRRLPPSRPLEAESPGTDALQAYETMGCSPGLLPGLWSAKPAEGEVKVRILSYNLFWWNLFGVRGGNGGSASRLIAGSGPFDFMGFQECEDVARVLHDAGLQSQYGIFGGDGSPTSAVCMAYSLRSWRLLDQGLSYVAQDHLGKRAAQWMRLRHSESGERVFFMNHHGPLPINSGGRCGGPSTAYNLLQIVATHAEPGDVIILVGDFNANRNSKTIQHLQWRLNKVFAGSVFNGVDNIFSNLGHDNVVETRNLGPGGSDHDALAVFFKMGRRRPWWWPAPLPLF